MLAACGPKSTDPTRLLQGRWVQGPISKLLGLRGQARKGCERSGQHEIVPAADVQDRRVRRLSGELNSGRRLPEGSILRMSDPVLVRVGGPEPVEEGGLGRHRAGEIGSRGFCPQSRIGGVVTAPLCLQGAELIGPARAHGQPIGAVLVGPVGADGPAGHGRRDGGQALRSAGQGEELGRPMVREAVHADPARSCPAAPPPRSRPRRRPWPRARNTRNVPPDSPRAADVLDDHDIAVCRVPSGMREHNRRGDASAVGLTHQQNWMRTSADRSPDGWRPFRCRRSGASEASAARQGTAGRRLSPRNDLHQDRPGPRGVEFPEVDLLGNFPGTACRIRRCNCVTCRRSRS